MRPITSEELATASDATEARPTPNDCFKSANRSPHLSRTGCGMTRITAISSAALLRAFGAASVTAQNAAQNAIDRSLLLRQQQEQDLQNQVDDAARGGVPGVPAQPPGSAGDSLAPPQLVLPPAQLPSADLESQQIYQSQQQRLLQQQIQNGPLPAPMQEQQNQMQLQQFQREDQAQQLERDIQRSSNSALRGDALVQPGANASADVRLRSAPASRRRPGSQADRCQRAPS